MFPNLLSCSGCQVNLQSNEVLPIIISKKILKLSLVLEVNSSYKKTKKHNIRFQFYHKKPVILLTISCYARKYQGTVLYLQLNAWNINMIQYINVVLLQWIRKGSLKFMPNGERNKSHVQCMFIIFRVTEFTKHLN